MVWRCLMGKSTANTQNIGKRRLGCDCTTDTIHTNTHANAPMPIWCAHHTKHEHEHEHTHTHTNELSKMKETKKHIFLPPFQSIQPMCAARAEFIHWQVTHPAYSTSTHTRAIHFIWQATWRFTVCAVSAQLMQFRSMHVLYARHRTRKLLSGLRRWEKWVVLNTKRWILQQATEGANFMAIRRRIHLKTWTQMLFGCSAQFLRFFFLFYCLSLSPENIFFSLSITHSVRLLWAQMKRNEQEKKMFSFQLVLMNLCFDTHKFQYFFISFQN